MAALLSPLQLQFARVTKICLSSECLQKCSYLLPSVAFPHTLQIAKMSRYSDKYLEPIVNKEELNQGLAENDPRRHRPIKALGTDYAISPLFYDKDVQKFTNMLMKGGNKERVREIMKKLFEILKHMQIERYNKAKAEEKSGIECSPVVIFKQAIENCKPLLLTTRVVKGGVAYQVPVCASPNIQRFKSMKWIIESCRDRERTLPMEQKLAWELMDAYNHQGKAMRKKQEIHKICESNRAYAHLR